MYNGLTKKLTNTSPPPIGTLSQNALNRRIKRYLSKKEHVFFAPCAPGFEDVLYSEIIEKLDVTDTSKLHGGIEFSGDLKLIYSSNLMLKTTNRILLRIFHFKAPSYPELYNKCMRIPWELYLGLEPEIDVEVSTKSSRLHHTENISTAITDAIRDYYSRFKQNIQIDNRSRLRIFARVYMDNFILSIDTTGSPLFMRGGRPSSVIAPFRKTIASTLLIKANSTSFPVIIDPCCGSGTFLTEGAALDADHCFFKGRDFSFELLPFFNKKYWDNLKSSKNNGTSKQKYFGFDISEDALDAASYNIEQADIDANILLRKADSRELKNTFGEEGLIVANLPYGKRLVKNYIELRELYIALDKNFAESFKGWSVLFISSEKRLLEKMTPKFVDKISFSFGGMKIHAYFGKYK